MYVKRKKFETFLKPAELQNRKISQAALHCVC